MSGNDALIIKRAELISLLVESYLAGIDTAKQVIQTLNPSQEELVQRFEDKFGSISVSKEETN